MIRFRSVPELCQRYSTTSETDQMGMHNRSENCHGSRVICSGQTGTGADFCSKFFGFLLLNIITPLL
jgi:hypothetical protein